MKHLAALSFSMITAGASAQLTVTDSLSTAAIAQLLEGLNVSITNVQVNCVASAMGHFTGTSEMEITEGLLLTSGRADYVVFPVGMFASENIGALGDADLNFSLAGSNGITMDACGLEFDCTPLGDTLLFNFSFGSEEYPEFVNTSFNDIFAIYLTGPGFPEATNVAALPDGTPVSINNVNAGLNAAYYYDNELPAGQFVSYDGFTTNLTAFAEVSPEETYHFKIVIADVGDGIFDSGVFLEAFSFRSNALTTGVAEAARRVELSRVGDQLTAILPAIGASAQLVLMDASGRVVERSRITGDRTVIDLAGLRNGLYVLQVLGEPGLAPVRFVKD